MKKTILSFLILFIFSSVTFGQGTLKRTEFITPPTSSKMHTWWHWMAGNITKEGITKDLESMKEHGIVEASIINIGEIFTQKVDVPKVKFNSPEWIEMYQWALKEASRLDITIGIQTIDGFCTTGGTWITPDLSMKQYVWTKTSIQGGKQITIQLPQPLKMENYYRDEVVLAYPQKESTNSFKAQNPKIEVNKVTTGNTLADGNPLSEMNFKKNDIIDISFNNDFTANKLVLLPHLAFCWDDMGKVTVNFALSTSDDGKEYRKIADLELTGMNKTITASFAETKAKFFRLELAKTNFVFFNIYPIAELELLKDNELPLFQPPVTSFFEKVASVFDVRENALDMNYKTGIQPIAENSILDISKYMAADGTLIWKAPKGDWTILRFGYTSTGVKNDPATPEGLGLEADKMDSSALNVHINSYARKLIEAAGPYKGNTLKFLLLDSWEAHFQTWTKAFAQEFHKRRGYSILPWIPVLCGETIGNTELSESFLHDFRKTIAGLIDEHYYKHFATLSHRNGMELHGEVIYSNWGGYAPLDPLKSNEYPDVTMTEFWAEQNDNQLLEYKPLNRPKPGFPTYAALAFDKQIIGSEAYTGYAHYSETPADLKPFGDAAYCSGVNQLILHSFVHQPFDKKPGMTLGKFGGHYNRNNTVWEYNQDWMNYQARVQYVLQKGEPIVDVLFYVGDELPQYFSKSFINDLPYGTQANACNIDMLMNRIKVVDGTLSLGGKQLFPLLLLQNRTKMEYSTLKRIAQLVKEGAIVYGPKPLEMLSVTDIKTHRNAFMQLADSLWGNGTEKQFGKGKMISSKPLAEVITQLNVIPDLTTNSGDAKEIMFIHRKLPNADVYYIFNQQNKPLEREILFRVTGKTPEIWNAENGTIMKPSIYAIEKNQTRLPVSLKPYESKIIVFTNEAPKQFIKQVSKGDKQLFPNQQGMEPMILPLVVSNNGIFKFTNTNAGDYIFKTNNNEIIKNNLDQPAVYELSNNKARIEFFPASNEHIQPIEITKLKSFTEFDNPAIKYFAGKAKYTIDFNVSVDFIASNDSIVLNLGNMSATAEVILNGQLLAYAWQPNTCLSVKDVLKATNKLEVTVTNVCRNRFIGDLKEFGEVKSLWTTSPVATILTKDMPLKPSGLMGPVKLVGYTIK